MVRSTCQLRLFRRPEKNHIIVRPSVRPDVRSPERVYGPVYLKRFENVSN
ncbi:unnamed protein product [Callosobruchus maculatus]|uniref:Uncharacterized protein n=1 Tax=Callosobruchus maculatus TaxID=64391 RepID=A0A653C4R0_CALMS|nr:unnamed protein product [Callosobruchus maculatus]